MTESNDVAPEAPSGVDTERPSAARVYDWYLGGNQNWAVDREFGRRIERTFPPIKELATQNRRFLGRLVRAALDAGIRQFLDLGSGVPTVGNVHEIVRGHLPEGEHASVVYVDYEPVAVAHATVILERDGATDWAGIVQADLRDPAAVLDHAETRRLLDFAEPVCVLMIAVLHFVGDDEDPTGLVRRYRERLAPGSWLAISHMTGELATGEQAEQLRRFVDMYRGTSNPIWLRDRGELEPLYGGWPLVEPGFVHPADWRPDVELNGLQLRARPFGWCGVAERPR
ncbi:S-adenosyl methyltransferase [Prauserella shujinwangii]|uniref:S-adenosyl methyltransferase n=1 Tax=Prauserella shujinwangii TaxID=1453103 RepID=A0A2T0LLI0_9PSEU|nr:SAM-dependent methyltransferase [Prauserella shujinwangii]PRX43894.1 S-adenosyl methyltransferase [Prauserella shujinwangii]